MTVSYGGSVDPSDPLQAATLLIQAGRLTVDPVQIKVCITNARDPAKYSVYLLVQFRFFLNLDEMQNTTSFHELSDQTAAAQRNLISFLSDWPSSRAEEHDVDGVKYFLSCLAPAPALPSQISEQHLQPPNLQVQLYPFQQRSVYFMLNAEGYGISASGAVTKAQDHAKSSPFWKQVDIPTVDGPVSFWFNALTGGVQANAPEPWASGVLLAETMGLGKTIEIISLIQLNTPVERNALGPYWDEELKVEVKPVKATLIVTPLSLLPQWADELRNRAPDLKVLEYTGKSKLMLLSSGKVAPPVLGKKGTGKAFDAIEEHATTLWHLAAQDYDVILTTFQELQSDLNVARPPVQRSRRMTAEYSEFVRARSPLILLDFARVVMDEVQQVGGGKAAEMVSLINRDSSIAVSGTPAKTGLKDLLHVLRFLRVPNITSSNWDLMITNPHYTELFKDLFRKIAVRTSKQVAGKEMKLAVQTRCVVPILLGPVEKHNYDERLADSLTALGMDPRGYPLVEDWSLDSVLLRQCIRKLRQACTHPQIGEADGRQGVAKGVRSIEQVLATMMENNMKLLFESRRSLIAERFLSILLTKQIHNNPTTMKDHIISLQEALRNIHSLMADIRKTKLEYRAREKHLNGPSTSAISLNGKAKGVAGATAKSGSGTRDADDESDGDTDSDDDEEDMGDHLGGRTKAKKKADGLNFNARLRQARILLHKAHFLLGNAYFQCGKSTEEAEAYALADDVRKRLLRSSQRIASRAMELLREREKGSEAAKFPIPTAQYPGEEPPPDDEASEGLTDPDDEPHGDPSDHSDSEWGSQNGQRKGKGKGSEKPRMEEKGTKGKGKESAETHGRKMKKPKENATVALVCFKCA
ncbi:hypothetical protein DL93DRAFT_1962187 [Clavulina sp. PMI_390]|nr:hypothetical protein DL93DRAFT_1962187 [Clavulina sp. PMI_390]